MFLLQPQDKGPSCLFQLLVAPGFQWLVPESLQLLSLSLYGHLPSRFVSSHGVLHPVYIRVQISPSHKDICHIELGSIQMPSS